MLRHVLPLVLVAAPALADETRVRTVDLAALDSRALHDGQGRVALLPLDPAGLPLVARIAIRDGDEQEPHAVNEGRIRLALVEAGEIASGEGAVIDRAAEPTCGAGEVSLVPPGAPSGSPRAPSDAPVSVSTSFFATIDPLDRSLLARTP
jgi:hypothetical protein